MPRRVGTLSAYLRLVLSLAAGVATGAILAASDLADLSTVGGWDVAAIVFLGWAWFEIWPMGPDETARLAVREEPGRAVREALLLVASTASLVAIGLVVAGSGAGVPTAVRAGLAVASVVLSWAVVHTIFTFRYARLYYTGPDGGIGFNEDDRPQYSDFAYVSFTIGMTFQVSDTDLTTKEIRATALRHALLSFMFDAVIIATTINLLAGLVK
ncbi:MAG: hypothetical protein JWO79_743 [Actinomycetia bacterium]|jgi:uncharacterized membrane protein|nr:hypothetical protein [Actinomycetes bacterium]